MVSCGSDELHIHQASTMFSHTSTTGNDSSPPIGWLQVSHFVVCATQLEAEDRLQVLALEQHVALEPVAEIGSMGERRLLDDFIDT